MSRKDIFTKIKKVVIKIGTQVLTNENNRLDTSIIEHLVEQICYLIEEQKKQVIIVTSGAIAAGMQILGWKKRPKQLNMLQASASVGQSRLMRVYERLFKEEGLNVGQILLTRDIFLNPEREKNARQTIFTLLKYKVIPIINENDTVATEEIKFGDNDQLSAFVTELIDADCLIMLSDIDGVYNKDPKFNSRIKLIYEIKGIGEKILQLGKNAQPSEKGVGGIKSKIQSAKYIVEKGKYCIIANGKKLWTIKKIFNGEKIGTLFLPEGLICGKKS